MQMEPLILTGVSSLMFIDWFEAQYSNTVSLKWLKPSISQTEKDLNLGFPFISVHFECNSAKSLLGVKFKLLTLTAYCTPAEGVYLCRITKLDCFGCRVPQLTTENSSGEVIAIGTVWTQNCTDNFGSLMLNSSKGSCMFG